MSQYIKAITDGRQISDNESFVCDPAEQITSLGFKNLGTSTITINNIWTLSPGQELEFSHNYPYVETNNFNIAFSTGANNNLILTFQKAV